MIGQQGVKLHGGPRHGEERMIPEDDNIVRVFGAMPMPTPGPVTVVTDTNIGPRIGRYSRVHGTQDFEWDGWVGK